MIELYQKEGCQFCSKVRAKLTELNLDWISRTCGVGSPARKKLIELGGKEIIPFLVDGDIKMYESNDILDYLEKTYGTKQ